MDALLILSGVTLLVLGWIWLVIAAARLPAPATGLAIFLPVVALFASRLGYPKLPRMVFAAGCLLTLGGVLYLQQQDPDRFDLLFSGGWSGSNGGEQGLQGSIAGQRFTPERVLWRNNELLFEEGPPERVRRLLALRFDGAQALLADSVILKAPGDPGPWPELVLQWHQGALEAPGLRTLSGPYSLSLRFTPSSNGRVPLFISLRVPAEEDTWLRGETELRTLPPWLAALQVSQAQPAPRTPAPADTRAPTPASPAWGELSLLALLDEPEPFIGSQMRLTMLSGRVHEGRLVQVTDDRRIVLGQQRGASAVDFQFNPLDIARVERLSTR